MHLLSACCVCVLLVSALLNQVSTLETVIGMYGETLEIPCNNGAIKAEDVLSTKWKYDKGDGLSGDLLAKKKNMNVSISATDEYKHRVSMASNSSLLLSAAKLTDQRTFTCMVVSPGADITEYPVNVVIYKTPTGLEISDRVEELEIGKLTKLGTCVAQMANPPANITWLKNNKPLVADGKVISIQTLVLVDPVTGLSTTSSMLEYSAKKDDADAQFTCSTQHPMVTGPLVSSPVTFTITYSTENIVLQVIPHEPLKEGDNVTLKCEADGNPPPTSFNFHLKGELVKVEYADTYTITNVSRDNTGEYKCSLIDNPALEASENITVNYLDINLSFSGNIVRNASESLDLRLQINASGKPTTSWTKDNQKPVKQPEFKELTYSDSGHYECVVTMGPLTRKASFDLVVEGAPIIIDLSKRRIDSEHKVLACTAEGSPKPAVSWSINGTSVEEGTFANGRITHQITVVPTANLTVTCSVSNEFGTASRAINVSSLFEEVRMDKQDQSDDGDQTKLVVGVVVGLLVATAVIGLVYWVYMKKSKQGSWKTGEKENGSSEEEKKLEENSQKAEV